MDRHNQITLEATAAARLSGRRISEEVIRLQVTLIEDLGGSDAHLRPFIELARAARATGSEAEMIEARVAMWSEIERIEGNSVSMIYRESALLRCLLPFPEPGEPNDDLLAWTSETIDVARGLPSYFGASDG